MKHSGLRKEFVVDPIVIVPSMPPCEYKVVIERRTIRKMEEISPVPSNCGLFEYVNTSTPNLEIEIPFKDKFSGNETDSSSTLVDSDSMMSNISTSSSHNVPGRLNMSKYDAFLKNQIVNDSDSAIHSSSNITPMTESFGRDLLTDSSVSKYRRILSKCTGTVSNLFFNRIYYPVSNVLTLWIKNHPKTVTGAQCFSNIVTLCVIMNALCNVWHGMYEGSIAGSI
jgi:hypothetical protein